MQTIAFISTMDGVAWGGSEELWSQTALRLLKQGFNVAANLQGWPVPASQALALQSAGGVIEWRHPESRIQRIGRRIGLCRNRQTWLDSVRPSLVVISQGDNLSGHIWAEKCRQHNLHYVLIAQAANEQWWPEDDHATLIARGYEGATACFFVSQGNLNLTRTQIAAPLPNARVVRNPFNVPYNEEMPWPKEDGNTRMACVGRLEPKAKGQDILLEVLRSEKWRQRPLEVTFYGKGPNSRKLQALKEQYDLSSVSFGGFVADVREIWRTNHALILPSRFEGLPLALVEAMLCGRPVITTDVAGNAELLAEGSTGFIARAPTKFCLDETMERAWAARERWQQMGQSAGRSTRQQVPEDPVGVFADHLTALIK